MTEKEKYKDFLDECELSLANHLTELLKDNKWDSGSFILSIIPIFWEDIEQRYRQTIEPDPIYRPLYYVHSYGGTANFENITRIFIISICSHLEGCLVYLTPSPPKYRMPSRPFGTLVEKLWDQKVLSDDLADKLRRFNNSFNIPSKHFNARFRSRSRLDERTFSIYEAALAFVMMRNLSIQLFRLLKKRGVNISAQWPEFNEDWLTMWPMT
jgi:uncharacterized protein YktA (UPF0223 family)